MAASLNLSACPGPAPADRIQPAAPDARPPRSQYATEVFASPEGSDATGAGTMANPFATLQRALDAASYGPPPRAVWLRGGDFFAAVGAPFGGRAIATPRNSDTTVATWPADARQAVLWGGGPPEGLVWRPVGRTPGGSDVLAATVEAAAGPHAAALLRAVAAAAAVADAPAPIPQLMVGGRRMVRAQFPNANPETDRFPLGYYSGPLHWQREGPSGASAEVKVTTPARTGTEWGAYSMGRGGALARFEGSGEQCFWSSSPPAKVTVQSPAPGWTPRKWESVTGGVASALHGAMWGGWSFGLAEQAAGSDGLTLGFGRGGFQEARGWASGRGLFVENIQAELDAPGEWFCSLGPGAANATLFLVPWSNSSSDDPRKDAQVVAATLPNVLRVEGSAVGSAAAAPPGDGASWSSSGRELVRNFALVNVTVGATAATYMHAYEGSMSGGDWSVHRGAAVVLDGVQDCRVDLCTFWRSGGNALLLSGRNVRTVVSRTEVGYAGDSAIVIAGRASLVDAGSQPDVPVNTTVDGCFVHDTGVYGKQTAAVASILAIGTTVQRSVAFEGPRQGVVFMDGLGGGHRVQSVSMWRQMLETQDGGVVYQWDRLPILSRSFQGVAVQHREAVVQDSILRCDAGCVWPVDWDDGSNGWTMQNVVSMYGGAKNFQGHSKTVTGSLLVYVNYAAANGFCLISDGAEPGLSGYNETFANNTCISDGQALIQYGACKPSDPLSAPMTHTSGNQYFVGVDPDKAQVCCGRCNAQGTDHWSFSQYQNATGRGAGSSLSGAVPKPAAIAQKARAMLGLPSPA
uniref:Right handed beta helix domain-containing protein n=2 Tax=Cafeteria roenbergensis TaxID=33653 RepID=A0A7S0JSD6_CAFRO